MPYTVDTPPEAVKGLPEHAIEIFVAAYNSAFKQYEGDEAKSASVGWAAVKTKFEKKDDKWVAKESLNILAEIIQEAGRRGKVNDPKVQNVISNPDDAEAASVLSWLKEQKLVKVEDGQNYLSEAFAFAPSDNPIDWKLRLWEDPEKKVTKHQLDKAAAYLSPGGYKGQKVEIAKEPLPSVKRKIRAEYRMLGVEEDDIPKWVKETESRTIVGDYIPLTEAKVSGKGTALITVIKPGFNATKERYYPADMLARDYKVFEGVKMYADHPSESDEKNRPERSIKDWVATLQNVRPDTTGAIVGEAVVVEPWMKEKLSTLRDKNLLGEMGVSINAIGTATKAEIEGTKTNYIEKIARARSVDFVTEAGAGGGIQLYESVNELDVDLVGVEVLKERRPDLVKQIESAVRAEVQMEVKRKMELEEKNKELETTITTLTAELTDLKGKITEAEKAQKVAEAKSKIDEAVSKSELPDAAKAKLLERFKGAETAEGIAEAITSETAYIAALKETGKVKNLGGSVPDPKADADALKVSFKRMHPDWSDRQIEIAVAGR
ncbi:MAG: ChaB family protein [Dehalococcoidales bacterium]|nr:ChaB family protein [Dehalococcoidales bacterium]